MASKLDVWENELLEPVLARYQPIGLSYKYAIHLDDVLWDICFFLQEHSYSFPIILNIEKKSLLNTMTVKRGQIALQYIGGLAAYSQTQRGAL
jgi:hypothetical protein